MRGDNTLSRAWSKVAAALEALDSAFDTSPAEEMLRRLSAIEARLQTVEAELRTIQGRPADQSG